MFFTHYYVFLRKHFLYFSIILTTFAPAIRQQLFHPAPPAMFLLHCSDASETMAFVGLVAQLVRATDS